MTDWSSIRAIPVGGLVVVGFVDEQRVVVGSHSGLRVFDATTGAMLDQVGDPTGDYAWFQESPPTALYAGATAGRTASRWLGCLAARFQARRTTAGPAGSRTRVRGCPGPTEALSLPMTPRNDEPAASRHRVRSSCSRRHPPSTSRFAPRCEGTLISRSAPSTRQKPLDPDAVMRPASSRHLTGQPLYERQTSCAGNVQIPRLVAPSNPFVEAVAVQAHGPARLDGTPSAPR